MKASDRAQRAMLEAIADGDLPIGSDLPSEAQLAERFGVSRLTMREAVGSLADRGVLDVRQGRRNRIADPSGWSVLDPDVMAVHARLADDSPAVIASLMEARQVLEVGIARLAAERISEAQLEQLEDALAVMRAEIDRDGDASARADIAFHDVIVDAAGNPFLTGAFTPLQAMLLAVRMRTSASRQVRADAIAHHERILAALRARDADAAASAMAAHMEQTRGATAAISLARTPDRQQDVGRSG